MALAVLAVVAALFVAAVNANPVLLASSSGNCPTGYSQPAGSNWTTCYKVFPDYRTRKDAATRCRADNGTLASVPSSFENSFLYYLAQQTGASSFWLGVQCFNGDASSCNNDDGKPFVFNSFNPGQPTDEDICVYMSSIGRDSQKWLTFNCEQKFQYACEVTIGSGGNVAVSTRSYPTTMRSTIKTCPASYFEYNNLCYLYKYVGKAQLSGNIAAGICNQTYGGQLATVYTADLNNILVSKNPSGLTSYVAFGLVCNVITYPGDIGSCKWNDGTAFEYNAFYSNHPSTQFGGGGCCDFDNGKWWDCWPCDAMQYDSYICQAPKQ